MAFWGGAFVFDGIPCEEYELMVYDVGSHAQSNSRFASGVSIVEEKIPTRWKPYFYGVKFEDKLNFTLVFGVNEQRVSANDYLSRQEMETVASWLTGHNGYKWLEIIQPDMEYARYRCIITGLEVIEFGWIPWALKATVECDGPYAYERSKTFTYTGSGKFSLYNESGHNGYYYPVLDLALSGGGNISIINESDKNREFKLTGIPASVKKIQVDCDHGIITCDAGINMYPYCNLNFLRLKRGRNILNITNSGTTQITCEFPVNAGG